MAQVIFINPDMSQAGGSSKKQSYMRVQAYPQLGLSYLSGMLLSSGIKARILDLNVDNPGMKNIIEYVKKNNPVLIGIYTTSFSLRNVSNIIRSLNDARCANKMNFKIMLGGPHITYVPEAVFDLGADFGFLGEAEASIVEIVNALEQKNNALKQKSRSSQIEKLRKIPGLIYKQNKQNRQNKQIEQVVINPNPQEFSLDSLPFPHSLENPEQYFSPLHSGKVTTLITSRGCCFDCVFCGLTSKKKIRCRSVKNVVEEIKLLQRRRFDYFEFQDDFFTFDKLRTRELCDAMLKEKLKIAWGCETRADFLDYNLLLLMKKAGCKNVKIGVECGNEQIRKQTVGKKITNKQILDTRANCKRLGIELIAYFMIGLPGESPENINETIAFAKKLKPDYAEFHLPIPIPGSRLFKIALQEKKIKADAWKKSISTGNIPVYSPKGISVAELEHQRRKAYAEFYFSPWFLAKQLTSFKDFRKFNDFTNKIRAGLAVLRNL